MAEQPPGAWIQFFTGVTSFLVTCDRQYGLANEHYTEYTIERLHIICRNVEGVMNFINGRPSLSDIYKHLSIVYSET